MKLSDKIKKRLMTWCQVTGYDIVLPNFYIGAYEMDIFKLSASDICIEYEIKVSRSDFKNDFRKKTEIFYENKIITKHAELMEGNRLCNRFFFVVPEGLITKEEVPDHCGLIYYDEKTDSLMGIKPAKMLHKKKPNPSFYRELARKLAWRDAISKSKIIYLENKLKLNE